MAITLEEMANKAGVKKTSLSDLASQSGVKTVAERQAEGKITATGILTGIGKGALSTIKGMSSLGERGMAGLWKAALPKSAEKYLGLDQEFTPAAERMIPENLTTPKNTGEKIGYYGEQIGEFFIPIGEAKALAYAENLTKGVSGATKTGKLIKGATKLGTKSLVEGTEAATKTAFQQGDLDQSGEAFALGALTPVGAEIIGKAGKRVFGNLAARLERINLKLTPAQTRNLKSKVDDTVNFLTKKKIVGTPEMRFQKVDKIYQEMETKLDDFFSKSAERRVVDKNVLLDQVDSLKKDFRLDRDSLAINRQIDEFIDTVNRTFKDDMIPVGELNQLKRSTYRSAYSKAGDKVNDHVEHELGDVLRQNIEDVTSDLRIDGHPLGTFNKEYGRVITARKLLDIAKSRPQTGLVGKLVSVATSGGIGNALGGPVGAAVAAPIGQALSSTIAGTLPRSAIGAGSQIISQLVSNPQHLDYLARVLYPFLLKASQEQNQATPDSSGNFR